MTVAALGKVMVGFGIFALYEEMNPDTLRGSPEATEAHKDLGGVRKLATVEENGQYIEPKSQK